MGRGRAHCEFSHLSELEPNLILIQIVLCYMYSGVYVGMERCSGVLGNE